MPTKSICKANATMLQRSHGYVLTQTRRCKKCFQANMDAQKMLSCSHAYAKKGSSCKHGTITKMPCIMTENAEPSRWACLSGHWRHHLTPPTSLRLLTSYVAAETLPWQHWQATQLPLCADSAAMGRTGNDQLVDWHHLGTVGKLINIASVWLECLICFVCN